MGWSSNPYALVLSNCALATIWRVELGAETRPDGMVRFLEEDP